MGKGVLLLHGFGDTPQTLRYLAAHLHRAGYTVRAPLYPGHGRSPSAFFESSANDWIASARQELATMRDECEGVAVVGLSMGAAIAAILGAGDRGMKSVVLIAPYLRLPAWLSAALPFRRAWSRLVGQVEARHPMSIKDPAEKEKSLAYGVVNAGAIAELAKVARMARRALPRVTAATLIIQSTTDPRVRRATALMAMKRLGAPEKRLLWTAEGGHVITVDFGKEQVLAETLDWIERWGGQPRRARLPGER